MSIKNKNGERIIIGISEVHLAELEYKENIQKRIKLNHGTAMVDVNCPQKTIDILNEIVDKAYEMDISSENES